MSKEIVINVSPFETRVALLENRNLAEIFVERKDSKGIAGNIYKGRVTKILPGMQVAFVDIGLEKAGFLHQRDINPNRNNSITTFFTTPNTGTENGDEFLNPYATHHGSGEDSPNIENFLSEGQELMVQVNKDPMGSKGARITTYITMPGRYLVYMPMVNQIGISRRIENQDETARLKSLVKKLRSNGRGYIIRTAAENVSEEELLSDIRFLEKMWETIVKKNERAATPSLLHRDLDIVLRSIRDLYLPEVGRITIDNSDEHDRILEFAGSYLESKNLEVELYTQSEPIFEVFGLEVEIERALGRKVWLKSGGYIIIDQTEALTAIDVNTGKFVGKESQEDTILKTNIEAVKEIVSQLRVRNIGGLIIIDFIDMEKEENKKKVFNILELTLKQDRSRTKILQVSELGLVEMTRKRTRDSLNKIMCNACPCCDGKGVTKSPETISYEIFRAIKKSLTQIPKVRRIIVEVPPEVSATLAEDESEFIAKLEKDHGFSLTIKESSELPPDRFEISVF